MTDLQKGDRVRIRSGSGSCGGKTGEFVEIHRLRDGDRVTLAAVVDMGGGLTLLCAAEEIERIDGAPVRAGGRLRLVAAYGQILEAR